MGCKHPLEDLIIFYKLGAKKAWEYKGFMHKTAMEAPQLGEGATQCT